MSFQYSKKATNNVFKIIVLYPCYQFVVRYLTELYVITHIIILLITIWFHKIIQVLNMEAQLISTISITDNILNSLDEGFEVSGVFLDISRYLLINFGKKDRFVNYNITVLLSYWTF